jgi:hypothetical protein
VTTDGSRLAAKVDYSHDDHVASGWSVEDPEWPSLEDRAAKSTSIFLMQFGKLGQQVHEASKIRPKRPLGSGRDACEVGK